MEEKSLMTIRFAAISLMLFFLIAAAPAHEIDVAESDPGSGEVLDTSPPRVYLRFEEELQTPESRVAVYDSQGKQVDAGDGGVDLEDPDHAALVASLPPLPNGAYTVQWEVLLLDGDRSEGEFIFYVGIEPGEAGGSAEEESTGEGISPTWIAAGVIVIILAAAATVGITARRKNTKAG
jgi:methionine-rich copper-binding protein CopC